MSGVKCEVGTVNFEFCFEACHCQRQRSFLESSLHPCGCHLEHLGSQTDLSWNRLRASRATLGVFWTVLGKLQVGNMILGIKIHDLGGGVGVQNRRNK